MYPSGFQNSHRENTLHPINGPIGHYLLPTSPDALTAKNSAKHTVLTDLLSIQITSGKK